MKRERLELTGLREIIGSDSVAGFCSPKATVNLGIYPGWIKRFGSPMCVRFRGMIRRILMTWNSVSDLELMTLSMLFSHHSLMNTGDLDTSLFLEPCH